MNSLFFELIRVAIGTQETLSRPPSGEEWRLLYDMAKKQSLIGVCFVAVQRLTGVEDTINHKPYTINLPETLYLNWLGMAAQINMKNELVNQQCVELQKRLSADGFRSCILKGQSNLIYYGELGSFRQSGDIDVWLEGGYKRITDYVQRVSPTKEINQHHAQFKVFDDTEVELHFYPLQLNNPVKQRALDKFCDSQIESCLSNHITLCGDMEISAATTEFNLVFQLMHIYHHLFTEGIGLRQLMDYYFVLRSVQSSNVSSTKVQSVIHNLGLNRFASAIMWVLHHVFGLSQDKILWEPNEKDGKFLLNEIMLSGNFGHHDERVPKNMNYWKSFWYLNSYNLRLSRFDHWSWFWTPIMRIKGFVWRKLHGYN